MRTTKTTEVLGVLPYGLCATKDTTDTKSNRDIILLQLSRQHIRLFRNDNISLFVFWESYTTTETTENNKIGHEKPKEALPPPNNFLRGKATKEGYTPLLQNMRKTKCKN